MVRDLWALRLQSLQARVEYDASESEAEHSSQLFSSQSEGETTDATHVRKSRKPKAEAVPQLVDALSLCYIGSLLLRLPTTIEDLHQWVASGQLIYYRAIRTIAVSMRQKLPFNYNQVLDPQKIVKPSTLHKAVLENIAAYHLSFGMLTPPLNHVLVLYRWIRHLALPLEVYSAVTRLAKLLNMDFSYDVHAERKSRLLVVRLAEARLIGLIVVATKLLFPMDNLKRYPRKPTELAVLAMDWSAWSLARKEHAQAMKAVEPFGYEDALNISEKDVATMSDEKLDDYMDWYGSTIANEDVREKGRAGREAEFRRAMFRFFPTDRVAVSKSQAEDTSFILTPQDHHEERIRKVQASLKPIRVQPDGETGPDKEPTQRPGSMYKRFRSVDELSGYAKEFYEEAADVAGLPVEWLGRCVFHIEKRLEDWEDTARKRTSEAVEGNVT